MAKRSEVLTPAPESDRIEGFEHPRERTVVVGHDKAQRLLKHSLSGAHAPHAFILSGPKGIGKATLAYNTARALLGGDTDNSTLGNTHSTNVSRLIAQGAHPDLLTLRIPYDTKTKKFKTRLTVDEARRMSSFFSETSAMGGRRIVVIDAADDMNNGAANALLKSLEEPPSGTVIFLIVHNLGLMLDTIRSRCVHLPLKTLSEAETRDIIRDVAGHSIVEEKLDFAVSQADGSPGRALSLLTGPISELIVLNDYLDEKAAGSSRLKQFALPLTKLAKDIHSYRQACDVLETWIERVSREAALAVGANAQLLADVWAFARENRRHVEIYNLDREQALMTLIEKVDSALERLQPGKPSLI